MAFRNLFSPVWLAPGASHYWWYTFHDNRGLQIATADMKTPDAQCISSEFGERIGGDGAATYYVTIHNNGPMWVYYNLQGGGVV